MKYITILVIFILLFSCAKNSIKQNNFITDPIEDNNENIPLTFEQIKNYKSFLKIEEERAEVFDRPNGKIIHTLITGDNVRISGLSYPENTGLQWIEICYRDKLDRFGWIKNEHIGNEIFFPSELFFVSEFEKDDYSVGLCIAYKENNNTVEIIIYAYKSKDNTIYTFYWDDGHKNYDYTTIPGVYVYDPDLKQISHISYLGKSNGSVGVEVSSDLKYLLRDVGSSPGIRMIYIYDTETYEDIYRCGYRGEWNLHGYCIEKAEYCGKFDYRNNVYYEEEGIDLELREFSNNFIETNEKPKYNGLDIAVIVICEYNFITKERNIIKGEYLYRQ